MTKVKLRKIGNSIGVLLPKEMIEGYNIGQEIDLVITNNGSNVITPVLQENLEIPQVKKAFNSEWCEKHNVRKGSCGCQ